MAFNALAGEGVSASDGDRPVDARFVPWRDSHGQLIGVLKGRIVIKGDILTTGRRGDAES